MVRPQRESRACSSERSCTPGVAVADFLHGFQPHVGPHDAHQDRRDPRDRDPDRGLAVLTLVAHIVLALGDANPTNSINTSVAYWADRLQLGFRDLFNPADVRVRIAVNYGLAALVWLVASSVVARLVRRLG
jgi:hypothetical protein